MNNDLILGWVLGLLSSLVTSLFLFWLEGKREQRNSLRSQRRDDIRIARDWAKSGKEISLRGFDLQGANLSGKDLSGADLEDANLSGAQMWNTNFEGANLIRARFQKTNIIKCNFRGASLTRANFSKSIISGSDFSKTKLRHTDFRKIKKIESCVWEAAKIDETTSISQELRGLIEAQSQIHPNEEGVQEKET